MYFAYGDLSTVEIWQDVFFVVRYNKYINLFKGGETVIKLLNKKFVAITLAGLLLVGILYYAYTKVAYVVNNIEEVKFALEKPQLIQKLRIQYASKSAELDQSLLRQNPTPQEELIKEVTESLKSSKE